MALPQIGGARAPSVPLHGTKHLLTLDAGGSKRTSAAVGKQTRVVRIACDVTCWIAVGDSTVTAAVDGADSNLFPAGVVEYPEVRPNVDYIAAIEHTGESAGRVQITEVQ